MAGCKGHATWLIFTGFLQPSFRGSTLGAPEAFHLLSIGLRLFTCHYQPRADVGRRLVASEAGT